MIGQILLLLTILSLFLVGVVTIGGVKLRSNEWGSFQTVAPGGGSTRNTFAKIQDTVGVYVTTEDAGDAVEFIYWAKKIIATKVAGTALTLAIGQKVYFDAGNAAMTPTASGNTLCGRCTVAALAADTTVEMDLTGNVEA